MRRPPLAAFVLTAVLAGCAVTGSTSTTPSPPASPPVSPPASADTSDTVPPPVSDAASAQRRWAATGPGSYAYTIAYQCFCTTYGRWRVEVEDGRVVRGRPLDDQGVGPQPNPHLRTIDELLADAARAEHRGSATIEATYDPATGVPTRVAIDWIVHAIDDEVAWRITGLTAR